MNSYRYPIRVVVRDYLLAGIGVALFLPPVFLMGLPLIAALIFSALGGLFLVFGLQVYRRHRTRIKVSDDGLSVVPGGRELAWNELSKLVLSYFAVRRDRERGWMELKLSGEAQSVRLDSRLEGFRDIAACAALAAGQNGLELNQATLANLAALGIDTAKMEPADDERRG